MKQEKYPTCTLLDTTYLPEEEDYKDFLLGNDLTEDDYSYERFVGHEIELDRDDFFANLRYSKSLDIPVIIYGSCGLWYGRREIVPVVCSSLYDAVCKCADEAWDLKVELENGILCVRNMHHDGTNVFYIQPTSSRCPAEPQEVKDYMMKKFKGYLF